MAAHVMIASFVRGWMSPVSVQKTGGRLLVTSDGFSINAQKATTEAAKSVGAKSREN
jgi:hypothetical protein